MHLDGDPAEAIAELERVTRRGGRIVISDFDWDAEIYDHPDREDTRSNVQAVSDGIKHGQIGRALPRLLLDAGLTDLTVESHAIRLTYDFIHQLLDGHLEAAEASGKLPVGMVERWWKPLAEAEASGRFLAMKTAVFAAGTVTRQRNRRKSHSRHGGRIEKEAE